MKGLVDKFRNTGSFVDNNIGHSGRPFSATTSANIQAVRDRLQQSPQKSTRRLSQKVGISRTSVRRVIHKDLTLFPYKIQILQQQTDANKTERLEFCQRIFERIENNPGNSRPHFLQRWSPVSSQWTCQQTKHAILGTYSAPWTHPATIEPKKK